LAVQFSYPFMFIYTCWYLCFNFIDVCSVCLHRVRTIPSQQIRQGQNRKLVHNVVRLLSRHLQLPLRGVRGQWHPIADMLASGTTW
jgi:hypothetical protein